MSEMDLDKNSKAKLIWLPQVIGFCIILYLSSCGTKPENVTRVDSINSIDSFNLVDNPEWFYFGYSYDRIMEKKGKHEDGLKNGMWTYQVNEEFKDSFVWKIYKKANFKFSLPQNWIVQDSSEYFFLAKIPDCEDCYFLILEQENIYTPVEFIKHAYNYSLEDNEEKLVHASAKAIKGPNDSLENVIYQFDYSNNGDLWNTYGISFTSGNNLYDIGLRIEDKDTIIPYWNREVFTDIINCFKLEGEALIPSMEELVDINDLKF